MLLLVGYDTMVNGYAFELLYIILWKKSIYVCKCVNECVSGFFPLPLSRSLSLFVISRTMRAFPGHEERWMIRSEPADNTSL